MRAVRYQGEEEALGMLGRLTGEYQRAASMLVNTQAELDQELARVRSRHQAPVRLAARALSELRAQLVAYIEAHPELFERRKSLSINGVKVGYRKLRGKVEIADEGKTIERIRSLLPGEQTELLLRCREWVHKPSVYDLTATDLRRLGICIADDSDVVVCRAEGENVEALMERVLD